MRFIFRHGLRWYENFDISFNTIFVKNLYVHDSSSVLTSTFGLLTWGYARLSALRAFKAHATQHLGCFLRISNDGCSRSIWISIPTLGRHLTVSLLWLVQSFETKVHYILILLVFSCLALDWNLVKVLIHWWFMLHKIRSAGATLSFFKRYRRTLHGWATTPPHDLHVGYLLCHLVILLKTDVAALAFVSWLRLWAGIFSDTALPRCRVWVEHKSVHLAGVITVYFHAFRFDIGAFNLIIVGQHLNFFSSYLDYVWLVFVRLIREFFHFWN